MADNYSQASTFIPQACLAPGGAKRMIEILDLIEDNGGLQLEACSDGGLYMTSDDEYFSEDCFCELVKAAAKEVLIVLSFGISVAYTCSKLRPDEFGGSYLRAMPNGEVVSISTFLLENYNDQVLMQIRAMEAW